MHEIFAVLAAVAAAMAIAGAAPRYGLTRDLGLDALPFFLLGAIVGAHFWWAVTHPSLLLADPLGAAIGGGSSIGAAIGATLALVLRWRPHGIGVGRSLDLLAPAIPAAAILARLGCFAAGDDWGVPTDGPFGFAFRHGASPSTAGALRELGYGVNPGVADAAVVAVHPTQLYEAVLTALLLAILWRAGGRPHRPGRIFALLLVLFALYRVPLEFLRVTGDALVLGLTTHQIAAAGLGVAGAVFLFGGRTAGQAGERVADRKVRERSTHRS